MDRHTGSEGDGQFVTLGIEREVFAVPVETVLEILDMRPIFRLPDAPPYLSGLIDVRGRGVPAIDLRVKLGLPPVPPTENTRILVLRVSVGERSLVLGLIADRVFEVAALNRGQIEPPPEIGVNWKSDYIRGVARRGESFVVIFDLTRLFSSAELAVLNANAASETTADEIPRPAPSGEPRARAIAS